VSGVFFGIVTFATTLALAAFMHQTAGPEWAIGKARFNGFNGMGGMPPLMLPWPGGAIELYDTALYYFVLVLLLAVYLGLRLLVNGSFGNVMVAIREDPLRAELLGYDVRRYQLITFVIGSALAGLSGGLYTAWGQFITPASMGLPAAAMPIIWVAFSGRSDLTATLVGTFVLLLSFQTITIYSQQYALILMGAVLLATVLFVPAGFVHGLARLLERSYARARSRGEAAR
jgi:branched-chain amino acid transport system permease protein